jgi:hypothetical protein
MIGQRLLGYRKRYSGWLRDAQPKGRSSSPGRLESSLPTAIVPYPMGAVGCLLTGVSGRGVKLITYEEWCLLGFYAVWLL